MKFTDIPVAERRELLGQLQNAIGLQASIVEKDWWVNNRIERTMEA